MKKQIRKVVQQHLKNGITQTSSPWIDLSNSRLKEIPEEILKLDPKALFLQYNPSIKVNRIRMFFRICFNGIYQMYLVA